jgi:hypothetical protein
MKADFKEDFIKAITEQGYPVIACFECMDSSAIIYVKTPEDVFVDDYGSNYIEGKYDTKITIRELSEEGLYKLLRKGVRPGETDYDLFIEEGNDLEKWHDKQKTVKNQT